jgi:hypothetical protein
MEIFIQFLHDTPAVAFMLLLALLVTVVPVLAAIISRKKTGHADDANALGRDPPPSRFLGTQMDIAVLIFGLLLLLGVIGWVHKTFFG